MTQKKPTPIKGATVNPPSLKSYGRAFQTVSMSAAADARIREALEVRTPRTRRWFPLVWALPLAAACGCLLFWLTRPTPTVAGACEVTRESSDTRYAGNCDVELTAMTVHLDPDAKFVQQSSGVQLDSGTAHFSVRKVRAGEPPVEIKVPEASIVVLGTEFTVTVNDQSSRVHLRSGRVRFVHQGHGAVEMWPGQQLTFETKTGKTEVVTVSAPPANDEHGDTPELETPSTSTAQEASASSPQMAAPVRQRPRNGAALSKAAGSAASVAATPSATATPPSHLQLALELRARGRYDEALSHLENVNPSSAHAREVVDFEQATLTELQTPERACARYRQHLTRFPRSRYRAAISQKLVNCTAPDSSPQSPETAR